MASSNLLSSPLSGVAPLPFHGVSEIPEASLASTSKKRVAEATENISRPNKKARTSPKHPPASSSGTTTLTRDQQVRREKLLASPFAILLDPRNVQCKKCAAHIKLSQKGVYDLHHWNRHRKRCNKWSDAEAAERRTKNAMEASRLSTPPLTADTSSEFTGTSVHGEESPAPEPNFPNHPARPLTSHKMCADYMAQAHPQLTYFDLEVGLPEVPQWSWARLRTPAAISAGWSDAARAEVMLSPADWEDDVEDTGSAAEQLSSLTERSDWTGEIDAPRCTFDQPLSSPVRDL